MNLGSLFAFLGSAPPVEPLPSTPLTADKKPEPPQDSERWTTASTGVRTTAQWLATTVGAIATVILGAGPLISNKTDVTDWETTKWFLVLGAASVGVLGVPAVVSRLVSAMLPIEVTLDGLPASMRKKIEDDPQGYLPGDASSLTDFADRLRGYSRAAAEFEIKARRENDPDKKKLFEDRAEIAADNRDIYRRKRSELLAQAKYHKESSRLSGKGNAAWFGVASIAAVVGISAFTFLTHAPEDDADESPAPQGALLVPKEGSVEIWTQLALDNCLPLPRLPAAGEPVDPQSGVPEDQAEPTEEQSRAIPVFLLATAGENQDQYKVQTLGYPAGCGRYTFTFTNDVVDLVIPQPKKVILLTPSETPSK